MKRTRYLLISIAVIFSFVFSSGFANAKPTWKERREVNTLLTQAKKLVRSGDLKQAAKNYKRADAIMPKPSYKVELGKLLIELGDFVQAGNVLREAMAAKPRQWVEKKAVKKSITLVSDLEDRTPTLEITMLKPDASKAVITVGGEEYDTADGATPYNPGDYEVAAEAPGYARWTKQLTLAEGSREAIDINMSTAGDEDSADGGGGSFKFGKLPAYIAWGVGGAGLITGIAFGVAGIQSTNELCRVWECTSDGEIQPKTKEEQDIAEQDLQAALTNGDVSTAGFIIGGVGIAAGTVLFLLADDEPSEDVDKDGDDAMSITAMPAIGPGYLGVTGTF